MTRLDPSMRVALLWALPIVALALVLGAEFDWGRDALRTPPPPTPQPPAPVSVGLLPDYAIPGGAEALVATSEHTLFNPTRRPAPPAVVTAGADGGPSQMRRGQFILTGTAVYGNNAVAYLKETAGGKPRTVAKGEKINGMLVAEVASDRVRFTLGSETEDLSLKVAAGPKTTVQPAAPRVGQPAAGGAAAAAIRAAVPRAGGFVPNGAAQPQTLAERRRAARSAEAERQRAGATAGGAKDAAGTTDAADNAQAPAAAGTPTGDPRWQQMYNRIRNRGAQPQ
ncbi:MAG: hypothetical protein ABI190_11880 [Casimicrobiaceae bacterium]